jgi:hypothetical protein
MSTKIEYAHTFAAATAGGATPLQGRSLNMRPSAFPAATATPSRLGRRWSWAALAWALAMSSLTLPTFGLGVVLAPVGAGLTAVAWRRAPHDGVFWVGATLNALALLGLLALLVGLVTGDVGIGLD